MGCKQLAEQEIIGVWMLEVTCNFVNDELHLAIRSLSQLSNEIIVFVDVGGGQVSHGQALRLVGHAHHGVRASRRLLLSPTNAHPNTKRAKRTARG